MNLLPWLLHWPPRPASVVAFLCLTAFSVGTLALFAPITDQTSADEATVAVSDASVRLNDDIEIPDTENGTVARCIASGTPGDHLLVRADVAVETPPGGDGSEYDLEVSLVDETTTEPVQRTGRDRVDVFWLVPDDETLSVGETVDIRVHLRDSGTAVANATRAVTVEEGTQSHDCTS